MPVFSPIKKYLQSAARMGWPPLQLLQRRLSKGQAAAVPFIGDLLLHSSASTASRPLRLTQLNSLQHSCFSTSSSRLLGSPSQRGSMLAQSARVHSCSSSSNASRLPKPSSQPQPLLPPWVPCAATLSRRLCSSAADAATSDPLRKWGLRAGHAAFVMLAAMYFMTDVVLLRVLGIVANLLDMAYCYKGIESPLWLNIRWGALYVAINVVQLYLLYHASRSVQLDKEARELYMAHFEPHGITQPQFAKLLASATRREFGAGVELVREGERASTLLLLTGGSVAQLKGGIHIANADSTFVGNLAFLVDEAPAYQTTFVACSPARALEWCAEDLKSVLARNPELGVCVRSMLQHGMLKQHRSSLSHAHLTAYTSIIAGVVSDGIVSQEERAFCAAFRERYHISTEEHASTLTAAGWTLAAFDTGLVLPSAKQ